MISEIINSVIKIQKDTDFNFDEKEILMILLIQELKTMNYKK